MWRGEDEAATQELRSRGNNSAESSWEEKEAEDEQKSRLLGEFESDGVSVPYAEIVRLFPTVRQSYVEGSQGEVGAAVASCHHWKRQAEACFQQLKVGGKKNAKGGEEGEGRCMKLQLQFMLCMGEHVLPQRFEQFMGCMRSKGNDISRCEEPLLEIMTGLEEKAQIENRQRVVPGENKSERLLTDLEQQGLYECSLTGATQSEIDCMIPKVCGPQHDTLVRCLRAGTGKAGAADVARCLEPAKQALRCWGAFNNRRARDEEASRHE